MYLIIYIYIIRTEKLACNAIYVYSYNIKIIIDFNFPSNNNSSLREQIIHTEQM